MEKKSAIEMTIDGKEVIVEEGMTVLEAAQRYDICIPTLCHHPALTNWGGCRMCVVEVDGAPKLVASCVMPVRQGMEVVTSNERILEHRRTILEFLFAERNHNCMFCPLSGDCELQQMAYDLQMDHFSVSSSFNAYPTDITNENMGIDHNRCILCGRCVRACHEIAGAYVLNFQNRGPKNLIGLDLNDTRDQSSCLGCGVCLQVCPTGAIFNRYRTHYAVKGHRKDWQKLETFCPQCGLLCPIVTTVVDNIPLKVEGLLLGPNGRPDRGQLCARGRFEVFKSKGQRFYQPMIRRADGTWLPETWGNALSLTAEKLLAIKRKKGNQALFGLASSSASNETLFAFRELLIKGFQAGYLDTLDGKYYRAALPLLHAQRLKKASWKSIPESDFILMIGQSPCRTQPLISNVLRKITMEKKVRVGIINSSNSPEVFAITELNVEKEKISLVLEAFLRKSINTSNKKKRTKKKGAAGDEEKVKKILKKIDFNNQDQDRFYSLVSESLKAKKPLIIIGDDVIVSGDPSGLKSVVKLMDFKGSFRKQISRLIILKPFGNSAAAWNLGLASAEPPADSDGYNGGVLLLSNEAMTDHPMITTGKNLEFLAVFTPYLSESLKEKAQVIFPLPLWLEEEGTYCSLDGEEVAHHRAVLKAPEGVRNSWQTLLALGEKIGFKTDYKDFNDLRAKVEDELSELH